MRFTHTEVNFDLRYEGHQNCPKILSMNILRVFSDHHLWRQNWCQYLWTSFCQFNFFVNLLHSLGVWIFDIWHLFDNLTFFWQLDTFLIFWEQIAHGPHCPYPCTPLPMYPIAHMAHTPCVPIAHVLHTPVPHTPSGSHCLYAPLPMWPTAHMAHTPCTPYPLCPIAHRHNTPVPHCPYPLYPIPPVPPLPIGPMAHTPCTSYPLYTIAPCVPLPITPAPHWVMGHMGNGGNGVQGVWATWAMGPMGNVDTGGNGV